MLEYIYVLSLLVCALIPISRWRTRIKQQSAELRHQEREVYEYMQEVIRDLRERDTKLDLEAANIIVEHCNLLFPEYKK